MKIRLLEIMRRRIHQHAASLCLHMCVRVSSIHLKEWRNQSWRLLDWFMIPRIAFHANLCRVSQSTSSHYCHEKQTAKMNSSNQDQNHYMYLAFSCWAHLSNVSLFLLKNSFNKITICFRNHLLPKKCDSSKFQNLTWI